MALLRVARLSKSYGGTHALRDVSLSLEAGEIHALCGENGAGKSTLIKCLSGVIVPDAGEVEVGKTPLRFGDVQASVAAGIAVVHQESTAFGDLNAVDNIFVGRELRTARGCLLDRAAMRRETHSLLRRLQEDFDLTLPLRELSVAQRQMVSMARALSQRCRILIMDEPTASLSARETKVLMAIIRRLRDDGVTIVYVSHRLDEVFALADHFTVLRDGKWIATKPIKETNRKQLIQLMVGREVGNQNEPSNPVLDFGEVRLETRGLSRRNSFQDVSIALRAGQIVGLGGLVGAGRSEVARAIFGIDRYDSGEVLVDGIPLPPHDVRQSMQRGLALVPEDRQHEGLLLPMDVRENASLAILDRLAPAGLVNRNRERELVQELIAKLQIKTASLDVSAETLSGGNQQKLVIAKWMATEPCVLILDEPTRGVDVGSKAQVHALIRRLAAAGMATLLISSEFAELLSICDRVIVMCEGLVRGEVSGKTATQHQLLQLALPDSKLSSTPEP